MHVTAVPHRTSQPLLPDLGRVIARPYAPAEDRGSSAQPRLRRLLRRIVELPEEEVARQAAWVRSRFSRRHRGFEEVLDASFQQVAHLLDGARPSAEARFIIGAFVTHEFTIDAAALFNPSMVPAPDQEGVSPGECRFVMSLRAVGEGHISSIEFRTGVLDEEAGVHFDPAPRYASAGTVRAPLYQREAFLAKLAEMDARNEVADRVLGPLQDRFSGEQLDERIEAVTASADVPYALSYKTIELIRLLAASNYLIEFPADVPIGERVLFPRGPNESHGMEDARFVRFVEDDGKVCYYATYTAWDGSEILPQLILTEDFASFRILTLSGAAAKNKGMALFPRRLGGRYAALSRYDRENIDLMFSDDVRVWQSRRRLRAPRWTWELMQLGNCGSPLETEAGWLVLTHGVGPMRTYSIGAVLLDRDDPERIVGDLAVPLLASDEQERNGYVPNVVYSCGGLLHAGHLVLPYGFSDYGTRVASIPLEPLLERLTAARA